jgi:hypothetical protein
MIVTYLLLAAVSAAVIFFAISKGCHLMALINILEEAQRESTVPDQRVITEVDRVFTLLCYLVGVTLFILFLIKILYEQQ